MDLDKWDLALQNIVTVIELRHSLHEVEHGFHAGILDVAAVDQAGRPVFPVQAAGRQDPAGNRALSETAVANVVSRNRLVELSPGLDRLSRWNSSNLKRPTFIPPSPTAVPVISPRSMTSNGVIATR